MIKVFHGSCVKVDSPDISFSRKTLDFGSGFYVTPLHEQAVRWALRWERRHRKAIVNTYCFHDALIAGLGITTKNFPAYDGEWLHFVGVANDKVFNTLELYFAKLISEDQALDRLKYEKPNHQICIRRQELIGQLLTFESAEEINNGSR